MNDDDEAGDRLANLPPPWPVDPLPFIRASNVERGQSVVVLDDDPTGTQTVHDVPVLSEWSVETFAAEFRRETPLFYVLTNSRALSEDAARQLAHQIGLNLREACRTTSRKATVISRSDSTLRGHYPSEVDALLDALDQRDAARLLVPFFEEGGRLTVDDVHYVLEGTRLVPAAETPFARDPRFAFSHSNLRDWVEEKTGGRVARSAVHSISLTDLRRGGPDRVAAVLAGVPAGGVCVGNAVSMRDVEVLVAKGGITSSDVATAGLGMKRAMVLGQILPGIPVWRLGSESRFPGMKYIVFPGNVGGDKALSEAYRKLAPRSATDRTRAPHPTIP